MPHPPAPTVLQLASQAWRERWSGVLFVTLKQRTLELPFGDGAPCSRMDFQPLNAYAHRPARFQPGPLGRAGDRATLAELLYRKASASPRALLPGARLTLAVAPEALQDLELAPELSAALTRQESPELVELLPTLSPAAQRQLWQTLHLGLASTVAPPSRGLPPAPALSPSTDLDDLKGISQLPELHEVAPHSQQLLQQALLLSDTGRWRDADRLLGGSEHCLSDPTLAACRGWVLLNLDPIPSSERRQAAQRWLALAEGLGASEGTRHFLRLSEERLRELRGRWLH